MNLLEKRLQQKYPDEKLKVLSYTKMQDKATVQCLNCNDIFNLRAKNFLSKTKTCVCCKCSDKSMNFQQRYQEKINEKFPNEKILIIDYNGARGVMKIKCLNCGTITTFDQGISILRGDKKRVCPHCFPNKRDAMQNTIKNFSEWIKVDKNFKDFIIPQRINSNSLIESTCVFCNEKNYKTIYDYMRGIGCLCGRGYIFSSKENMQKRIGKNYEILDFSEKDKHALIRHKDCNFIYKTNFNKITCPKCKGSKGEQMIRKFLSSKKIVFIEQFGLKIENHNLRFDFYLPAFDFYIEYQGKQHYESIDFFGGEESLIKQQRNDELKRKYCKNKLLEIRYDEDIEEKINSFLIKLNEQVT